jgi:hypothetical protein
LNSERHGSTSFCTSVGVLLALACMFTRCDESLPLRVEPQNYLALSMVITGGQTPGYLAIRGAAWEALSFHLELKNLHDEVLEDTALVQGKVEISLRDIPSASATITGGAARLYGQAMVHAGRIAIRPDSAAVMDLGWNNFTDDNRLIWSFVNLRQMTDPSGVPYLLSDPVELVVKASFQVFRNVQATRAQEALYVTQYQVYARPTLGANLLPFPIEQFRGFGRSGGYVKLFWQTPFEIQNYGFVVQRRLNGGTAGFVTPPNAFVPGNGTTGSVHFYSFSEGNVPQGSWAYRLQQIADLKLLANNPVFQTTDTITVVIP